MASSSFYHKPELALRRALELQGINQGDAALSLLHEVLSSRRNRTAWSPTYEEIMITYLNLCLQLDKAREAKDGLHQYRNLASTQAPGSLEKVLKYLMEKAEQKCTKAKAFVDAETLARTTGEDDEDGFAASPQAILLSTMSTDPAKSQRDSTVLLPSLKFLWETYRAVLDILRSSSKLEHVYHAAAQGALRFCRTYKRRVEFRHLCEMLRTHLVNLRQFGSTADNEDAKSSSKVRGWEGWTTESIELHLQTRFAQLETASVLHRYTEGFKTVEDIYNILQVSHARRKANPDAPPPKAKLMAAYYEKLTTLFWVSENYLFHAFAWYKYYTLCKEYNRGMSPETSRIQASAVLLAALCIPHVPNRVGAANGKSNGISSAIEDDIVKTKMSRMATLLGFHTRNPTREALLTEIRSKNILDQVPQYLRDLYVLLEETTDPLIMVEQAQPLLKELQQEIGATTSTDTENDDVKDSTLGRYVKPLSSVLLLKLVVNLSAAYHTVSMDHLKKLTSGLDMTFEQVEKSIVQFTQSKALSVRLDHRAGCLRFGDAQLESDVMRSQLTVLSKQLEVVSHILEPQDLSNQMEKRTKVYEQIRSNLDAEHAAILERKNLIEKRKEEAERLAQEKVREEMRIKAQEEAARKAEEEKRIAREQKLREQEKQRKIEQELENQEKKRYLVAMGKKAEEITEEQIAKINTEALQKEHQEKVNKKKEEAERRTREIAKKLDYLVRAIRIEELPLIKKKYEESTKKDRELYEQETVEKMAKAKEQWEDDVKAKEVLQKHFVFDYMSEFEDMVMAGRKLKHKAACDEEDKKAELEAERAKIKRARKRKDEELRRLAEEEVKKKEAEANQKEEEEKRKKEEARREKEAHEEELRQAEVRRMDEERRKKEVEQAEAAPPPGPKKYVPPSARARAGATGSSEGGPGRFSGSYPGGGRYEGRAGGLRADDGGRDERSGGGPGGDRWRRDGNSRGFDDRRDDRRGFGDDRRAGGGGFGGDRDRRGFGEDRRGPGGGGGVGGDRRSGGDRNDSARDDRGQNTRWRN